MAYRVKTRVNWAGRVLYAGELLEPLFPGRNYAVMERDGLIEKVEDAQPARAERPTVEPETTVEAPAEPPKPAASTKEDAKPKPKRGRKPATE